MIAMNAPEFWVSSLGVDHCRHSFAHASREGFQVVKRGIPSDVRCDDFYSQRQPHPPRGNQSYAQTAQDSKIQIVIPDTIFQEVSKTHLFFFKSK